MRAHPNRRALRRWAAGRRPNLSRHIESCERCLRDLEDLTALDPSLRNALQTVTQPEPGFMDRLETGLQHDRSESETWQTAVDLLSLGWRTLETLMEENDD